MRHSLLIVVFAFGGTGCTMMSLERHTVAQSNSAVDLRYHEVLENLAMVARDPSSLPSYSSIFSGTIFVQDQGQLTSTNVLPYKGAVAPGAVGGNISLNRQISQNFTLDPVATPEKLEAIRAACQWAVYGAEGVNPDSMSLLIRAEDAPPGPGRHFGVSQKLAALPCGWLGKGCLADVPACARYKAHAGSVWVWVKPDGMKGLTDFTLIIQEIARVSINSPSLFRPMSVYPPIIFETTETADTRRGNLRFTATVTVDQGGHLVTGQPVLLRGHRQRRQRSRICGSVIGAAGIATVAH